MSTTIATLLETRGALQSLSGGQHPALTALDRLIAKTIKVQVYLANAAAVPLADVMGDDDSELAHVLDQLSKGNLATGGGGALPSFVVERVA